jgi:hypothetical protein
MDFALDDEQGMIVQTMLRAKYLPDLNRRRSCRLE